MAELSRPPINIPPYVQGYFDESGKWKDSDGVVVFAGIVGFKPTLISVVEKWAARLSQDKITHTSMKDAMGCHGPLQHLLKTPDVRDKLLIDLATIVSEHNGLLRVASPLDRATQQSFNALPQEEQKSLGGNPYYGAFEACILGALDARSDVHLQVVCDLAEEYSEKCIAAFHKIRRLKPEIKSRCLGISFSDDTWNPALQIADMLAYCERAMALEKERKEPVNALVQKLIDILFTDDRQVRQVVYYLNGSLGGSGHGELE